MFNKVLEKIVVSIHSEQTQHFISSKFAANGVTSYGRNLMHLPVIDLVYFLLCWLGDREGGLYVEAIHSYGELVLTWKT